MYFSDKYETYPSFCLGIPGKCYAPVRILPAKSLIEIKCKDHIHLRRWVPQSIDVIQSEFPYDFMDLRRGAGWAINLAFAKV